MDAVKHSARTIAAKQIIELKTGSILNGLAACTFSPDEKALSGIIVEDQGTMKWISRKVIHSFSADVVIVDDIQDFKENENNINPIGMPAITNNGILIGRILDVAIDNDGNLLELLLDGGMVRERNQRPSILPVANVDFIGKDVFICSFDTKEDSFLEADKSLYKLALTKSTRPKDKLFEETIKYEEVFDQMTKHVSHSMNELGSKISEKIKFMDKDSVSQELNRFTDSLNREVGKFMDNFNEQFSARKKEINQKDIDAVLNDLSGNTVRRPVNDKKGQVIVMPGQLINEEKIRDIIAADKVAELYRMAVPLDNMEAKEYGE